jgi:lipopolysaccharide export system protein LptA
VRRGKANILIIIFFLTSISIADENDVIIIRNADSLVGKRIDGENIRELIGNVILQQREVTVYCDRAIQYPARNSAFLDGNVRVVDDTVTLFTDQGFYNGNTRILDGEGNLLLEDGVSRLTANFGKYYIDEKIAEFWENVVVVDPAGIVYADHLIHRRDDQLSRATGNVRVVDPARGTTVFGEELEYESETGYSKMKEVPMLMHLDTTDTGRIDTLIVLSKIMESLVEEEVRKFVAIDSVEIHRSELSARGMRTVYFVDEDELSLTGTPVLWYQDNQITGDSIHVRLENQQLRSLEVNERSFVISRSDTRYPDRFNQLTGITLTMWFHEDEIEKVEVHDQATSLYYLYEDLLPNGVNHVTGDKITLLFVESEVHELKIEGGIEGKYYPENIVRGREQTFNLPGFQWREDRPVLSLPIGNGKNDEMTETIN